jgi:uncharacterized membrane protein
MDQLSRFHFQYFLYIFLAKMFTNIIPNSNVDIIVGVVSFEKHLGTKKCSNFHNGYRFP